MNQVLRQKFEKLQRQKHSILAEVAGLSAAQLRFRPDSSAWSVLEVIDHLVKVEKALMEAVRKQLPNGTAITLRDRIGALFIISVMLSPMRVKVPASASMVLPAATRDLSAAVAGWTDVREQMDDLLCALRPEQLHRGFFRHPVSGWMTIADALAFLSAHLHHHRYQIDRLKSAARRL